MRQDRAALRVARWAKKHPLAAGTEFRKVLNCVPIANVRNDLHTQGVWYVMHNHILDWLIDEHYWELKRLRLVWFCLGALVGVLTGWWLGGG